MDDIKKRLSQFNLPAVKNEAENTDPSKWIYTANEDVEEKMVSQLKNGRPKGTTTYFQSIDPCWTWRAREMNIWTGYNNQGKTALLNELTLCRVVNEDLMVPVFSPENMPEDEYFMDLAETFVGKPADKDFYNCMSEREMREAIKFLRSRFCLIYPERGHFTIKNIELGIMHLKDKFKDKIQLAITDPYIKIKHDMGGMPEHLYASQFMMDRVAFCRDVGISYNLVMHQTTPQKKENGLYPEPSGYRIKGGGTFSDSTDNVLLVSRPQMGVDRRSTLADFTSEKIKKQKLTGQPGTAHLDYSRKDCRFYEADPEWLKAKTAAYPDFDWRDDPEPKSYSPLAKLKGEPQPQYQPVEPKMYGPINHDGTEAFENEAVKIEDDGTAPF